MRRLGVSFKMQFGYETNTSVVARASDRSKAGLDDLWDKNGFQQVKLHLN